MHRKHIVIYSGSTLWFSGTLSLIDQSVLPHMRISHGSERPASPTNISSGGCHFDVSHYCLGKLCCAMIGYQTDFEKSTIKKVFKLNLH